MLKQLSKIKQILVTATMLLTIVTPAMALDTDIYQSNVKQNCYILLDASYSMGFGVYESNIDYGKMFNYLFTVNDSPTGGYEDYIFDGVMEDDTFYLDDYKLIKNRIYLMPGQIGIASRSETDDQGTEDVGDDTTSLVDLFSGDAADPTYTWWFGKQIDTCTDINEDGNFVLGDGCTTQRLTVNDDGYVRFDHDNNPTTPTVALPLVNDTEYIHEQILYGGAKIKDGFGDLLNAPGYFFSGYTKDLQNAVGGEETAYFFITGNWMNMQAMYNLVFTENNPPAKSGDPAWMFERYPLSSSAEWPQVDYALSVTNYNEPKSIVHPAAIKIRVRFDTDTFDIKEGDYVLIEDSEGTEQARYDHEDLNDLISSGGWCPDIDGTTVKVTLIAEDVTNGSSFSINKYSFLENLDGYLMKSRLKIATNSILNTIEYFRGKINWGTFTFPAGANKDGATSHQVLNPNLNDDLNRSNIAADFGNIEPADDEQGTNIGEGLQDVFEVGYFKKQNSIDNLTCRKNYTIVLSDGFPSEEDDNWGLIGDVTFEDFDGDGFRGDPYENPGTVPPFNYYDDVAHWMYTHSWYDKTEVTNPAESYENVSSHQICFGFQNPLMRDAAEEGGGMYITAYNEGQLNAAFYAIGLAIAEAVSFTAPVVSVDAANKIQNGDDLYMGQFLPMDASYWPGNLKKYKLGDGSPLRPDAWQIYDAGTTPSENEATNDDGTFKDHEELEGFWSSQSPDHGGLSIHHDGVGEVLTTRVKAALSISPYERNINTLIRFDSNGDGNIDSENLISFDRTLTGDSVTATLDDLDTALGTDAVTRDKIINLIHGYTFAADGDGNPVAARDWSLGAIIHSRPTVIDYYQEDTTEDDGTITEGDYATITKRLIAVGSDDGMLHVFQDTDEAALGGTIDDDGKEVFAYIPSVILPELKRMESEFHFSTVDGFVKLFRRNGQPKYLFCGLRRGGRGYVRIDVSNSDPAEWTVKEITSDDIAELGQTWSDISFSKIQTTDGSADPEDDYTDVVIFSGGYDAEEDNFPEPFNDLDLNGTPYADNGQPDRDEWVKTDATQDLNGDGEFTLTNTIGNLQGRGVFVLNIDSLEPVFSVTYNSVNNPATVDTFDTETNQTRSDMKYCFPATPSVVSLAEINGTERIDHVLAAIYAPDVYGNLFRITYDYLGGKKWQVAKLFSANATSSSESSELRDGIDSTDSGRKVFYGPAVSWRGSGRYFDSSNYHFETNTFAGTNKIASLFFGTGDRVHPTYRLTENRVYAIYDDTPVTANDGAIKISLAPYTENDLLNITCDELGVNTLKTSPATIADTWAFKSELQTLLTDDVNNSGSFEYPDSGAVENDAKGWYIILQDQGGLSYCDHCDYEATVDDTEGGRDYHVGEKVLSKFSLFAGNLYFTTYQPAYDDPCVPEGNAFAYALNYLDGSAGLNLNSANDDYSDTDDPYRKDVTDRYGKYSGVKGIPSGFEVVIRGGEAGAMASLGGGIIGGGEDGEIIIPYEDSGISLYYWIEK